MSDLARRSTAEAIGTFFLVLIGPGAAMVNAWSNGALGGVGVSLAFAFVVTAMVASLGQVSGCHINPAVTLTFWSTGRFPAHEVAPYIGAQLIGAVAASGVLRIVLGDVGSMGATLPTVGTAGSFVVELLLSFVLMLVIMGAAVDERAPRGLASVAIGLTVGFCALMGGPMTGASMNPARSFGPALVGGYWQAHWVYWLAPVVGMAMAARAFDWLGLRVARPVLE